LDLVELIMAFEDKFMAKLTKTLRKSPPLGGS
jgi:acyl carrier protein